jgi:hypothetical protein
MKILFSVWIAASAWCMMGEPEGAAKLSHILCSTYLVLVPAIAHHIFQQELY